MSRKRAEQPTLDERQTLPQWLDTKMSTAMDNKWGTTEILDDLTDTVHAAWLKELSRSALSQRVQSWLHANGYVLDRSSKSKRGATPWVLIENLSDEGWAEHGIARLDQIAADRSAYEAEREAWCKAHDRTTDEADALVEAKRAEQEAAAQAVDAAEAGAS
jgi:hypothetical protein